MIGDRCVVITTLKACVGDLLYCRTAVAPFGVHLQVPAVLLKRRTRECGVRENAPDFDAAEEVSPKMLHDVSLPVGPTNGWPLRSSASPGCTPISVSVARAGPSPNTVCVACL